MKAKQQSIFMQMHNGTRTGEGSFNVGLKELFYLADNKNKHVLVKAFPDFFGESVAEFNIFPNKDELISTGINISLLLELDFSPQKLSVKEITELYNKWADSAGKQVLSQSSVRYYIEKSISNKLS